jgi:glutamate-5-semialdehyde dehydrogenase
MKLLSTKVRNDVLKSMIRILDENRAELLMANQADLDAFEKDDQAMYDRLVVDMKKIDAMIKSVQEVLEQEDPVNRVITSKKLEGGLEVTNKTAPFGTIMIIYESRPDVTIEAAVLAFKANNRILLKGGKEALNSNKVLAGFWHRALEEHKLPKSFIQLLTLDRAATREFLKNPPQKLDLIVPRGGERLISFVKEHATCAVLVSGRGNNFLYVDRDADWEKSLRVILNAKTQKISACNALDKILMNREIPGYENKLNQLRDLLSAHGVNILVDKEVKKVLTAEELIEKEEVWQEEFLALKCCIGAVNGVDEAIEMINTYSGGHSASIMTLEKDQASRFMEEVDSAAVYHNASTRFTDGGQMGVGAELAISTDKLHHRGPLGLNELVTNKYYVVGDGHIRE